MSRCRKTWEVFLAFQAVLTLLLLLAVPPLPTHGRGKEQAGGKLDGGWWQLPARWQLRSTALKAISETVTRLHPLWHKDGNKASGSSSLALSSLPVVS